MGLQKFPVKRSETIQVPVNNVNAAQYKFTDNETTLDNIVVTGVVIHTAAVTKTFEGKDMVTDAIAKKSFLTLADKYNNQWVKRLPLETFYNDQKFVIELDRIPVDVRKSFIELQDKAGLTATMAWLVTFFYEKIEEKK